MARTRHVIIGDGIAGATAAQTIRDKRSDDEIIVLTDEEEPLYNRVKIKDFAKGTVKEEKVPIHTMEWYVERDIDLRLSTGVTNVQSESKRIVCADGTKIPYDKLLIATGGTPRRLPVPNSYAEGIFKFWTFMDARRMRRAAQAADKGIAIGAGLLGIDIAVVFAKNDVAAQYVMRGDRWWREGMSKPGSVIVEKALAGMGVECIFHETPSNFVVKGGRVAGMEFESGRTIDADIAGVAIGLNFNTEVLSGSRVKVGEGLLTDSYLQTSVPDIYAAGDIAQYFDVIQGRINMNGSWASARMQGKIAGANMAGEQQEFRFVDLYSINHFDFMVGSVGSILGDEYLEETYSGEKNDEYRRLVFKNDRLIGAVLIGNWTSQGRLKRLMEAQIDLSGRKEDLLIYDLAGIEDLLDQVDKQKERQREAAKAA